jgi:hypothetical protein
MRLSIWKNVAQPPSLREICGQTNRRMMVDNGEYSDYCHPVPMLFPLRYQLEKRLQAICGDLETEILRQIQKTMFNANDRASARLAIQLTLIIMTTTYEWIRDMKVC